MCVCVCVPCQKECLLKLLPPARTGVNLLHIILNHQYRCLLSTLLSPSEVSQTLFPRQNGRRYISLCLQVWKSHDFFSFLQYLCHGNFFPARTVVTKSLSLQEWVFLLKIWSLKLFFSYHCCCLTHSYFTARTGVSWTLSFLCPTNIDLHSLLHKLTSTTFPL